MHTMSEHERCMRAALDEARQSLAEGEFPVGCVMVVGGQIVAKGRRRSTIGGRRNEIDHAEMIGLRRLIADQPDLDLGTVTSYSTLEPCLMCYSTMLLSGIRTFVWAFEDVMGGGTGLPLHMLSPLYAQMRVHMLGRVLRGESLRFFQEYFCTGTYWQDSLLARYTMAQTIEADP
jgi:Cytosine/adenosine deaminases